MEDRGRLVTADAMAEAMGLVRIDPAAALAALDAIVEDVQTEPENRAVASYASARCALQTGQPVEALQRIELAREFYREAGQELAALRTDLGRINVLDDLGRHMDAAAVGHQLIGALEGLAGRSDDEDLRSWLHAAALENQGACMGCLGHHGAAAGLLRKAAAAYETVGAPEDGARVEANLGVEQLELGNVDDALALLMSAQEKLAQAGESDLVRRCVVYAAEADALAGRYQSALDRLATADSGVSIETDLGDIDGIRLLIARAEVLLVLHLWPEVTELAERLAAATAEAEMHRDLAHVNIMQARALFRSGDHEAAVSIGRAAIVAFDELGLPARAARARLALAEILPEEEALSETRAALEAFDTGGEVWGVAAASIIGAEIVADSDQRELWAHVAASSEAASFPELAWRLDNLLGEVARSNGDIDTAQRHFTAAHENLRDSRNTIDGDLHRLPFMSDRRAPLEALVSMALDDGDAELARRLSIDERSWLNQDAMAPSPTPGTVLYQSIDEQLSAFITMPDGTASHVALDVTVDDLTAARKGLHAQWRRIADPRMRVHLDQLRPAAESLLQDLYLRLFAPFEELLEPEQPVTIIPVGSMSGIPFHALHDGLAYLIERRPVYVAPTDGAISKPPVGRTLVVGVPDQIAPEIEREVRQIADLTTGTLLLSQEATLSRVADELGTHDVIHLACHGHFRPENPAMSSLQLADGQLTAEAIHHLPLSDKVVVLASCSSGLQRSMGEDETLGLPRAFLAAGASAVVMNLWPADDVASVGLMTQFHANLKTLTPNQALRAAQLEMMHVHRHPLLWAAPVVFGHAELLPAVKGTQHEAASTYQP